MMKNIIKITVLLLLCFSVPQCYAFAYGDISYQTIDMSSEQAKIPNSSLIVWTGREYLKWIATPKGVTEQNTTFVYSGQKSVDLVNWEESIGNGLARFVPGGREYTSDKIVWTGSQYLCRDGGYDFYPRITKFSTEFAAGFNKVYIYNADYELIHTQAFEGYVRKVSYANGKLYAQIYRVKTIDPGSSMQHMEYTETVYSSTNGIDWVAEPDMKGVPIATINGRVPIGLTSSWYEYYSSNKRSENPRNIDLSLWVDADLDKSIIFEKHAKNELLKVGKYFCTVSNWAEGDLTKNIISFSKDGVYWTDVNLPNGQFFNWRMGEASSQNYAFYTTEDSLVVVCVRANSAFVFSLAEIDAALSKIDDNAPYVMLNDQVLGFDTPPTVENDRTLVPLRFLFEQMGATVDWDDVTQTATVKESGSEVAFSIDNKVAKVNNSSKTMDVPARLINGKTMVPLRFLSEELGCNVEWDETINMARITVPVQ